MPTKIDEKTCLSCGACCISPGRQGAFCDISKTDAERLGRRFVRLNVIQPNVFDHVAAALDGKKLPFGIIKARFRETKTGPFKGREFNVCHALTGSIFHKVSCSVYNKRPDTCKVAVKPGDRQCRRLRKILKDWLKEYSV